jgi:hypothetical protein
LESGICECSQETHVSAPDVLNKCYEGDQLIFLLKIFPFFNLDGPSNEMDRFNLKNVSNNSLVVGELQGSCEVDEQCVLPNVSCTGEEGNFKCFCNEGFVNNADITACLDSESLSSQNLRILKSRIMR